MSINFQNIRPWNGSQREAFEELCCQLAGYERAPQGSNFIRKAPPDAGVECFWQLPNGDEWGWQAKFFLSPPNASQWNQINDSIKKALEKHPRLTSYTVCIPIDRQDPRTGQDWFMDKWKNHVETWKRWAQEKSMSVEFNYWGAHEIWQRLSREEHRGRHFFWFNKELFTQQWFEDRIEEAVANVGPRYTPELNVELPIARLFDGLGRTSAFYTRVKVLHGKIKRTYTNALSNRAEGLAKDEFDNLRGSMNPLLSCIKDIEKSEVNPVGWDSVVELASKSIKFARDCIKKLEEKKTASRKERKPYNSINDFGYERHNLYELLRELRDLQDFAKSSEGCLSNVPALLLLGDAGTGKTHLFCDVAKQRVGSGLSTLLLLGGQFNKGEPWSQIIHLLGLSCTKEEFLGALEASAQAQGSKALIFVDALNEGEGKYFWSKYLAGMLTILSRYTWIGIAISVRTSYEEVIIPKGLVPNRLIRKIHFGFAEHEYEAARTFFDYFGIERPPIPLLVPEFQNPLFLKLFCQGLTNRGLTRVPTGLRGITAVFNFFIYSINEKLSKPDCLDFDSKSQVIQKAVEELAKMMADKGSTWLSRDEAQTAVNSFLPREGYENSLFRSLISEGILAEDRFRIENDKWCDGVHFSYERFADHMIVEYLLNKHLDPENPSRSFLPHQPLASFIKDEVSCWRNRGIIEAFSIQLPERIRKELAEVAPNCADYRPVREGFIESLIWRNPKTITDVTLNYINKHVIRHKDSNEQFLNALLTVASNTNHPYNADFLHKHLMKFELMERDAWWSIFLHYQYGEHGAVDRLVDWAGSSEDKSNINDDSIRLCGIAVAWFLTTSNRYLRDRATKALVSLLRNRIHVLSQIIRIFLDVNDLYVLERLFAVAYGCAMHSTDKEALGGLAKKVYKWIFKDGKPLPHVLLRDYARGVVELALHHGLELNIDTRKIRPPYKSELPSFEIPTEKELKKYGEWQEGMPDEEWARVHLYESVMGSEDFARYIIGTNSVFFEWTSRRLDEPRKPSRKETYETFIQSLTKKQKQAWSRYHTIRTNVDFYRRLDPPQRMEIFKRELPEEELGNAVTSSEQTLRKTLGKKKLMIFEECVVPYLNDPHKDEYRFDLSIAQRWIFQKVLDLGWTVERFGRFDRNLIRDFNYGRSAHKPERIGKKYQWIAYHEFLARISDNFEFREDRWSDRTGKYEGPFQMFVRNIDPSFLLRKTEHETWQPHTNTWWFPSSYKAWDSEPDDLAWLKSSEDLPNIKPLIDVINPDDGSKWLALQAFYRWEQPTPPEEERFKIPRRDIRYMLKSYIVKKSDIDELYDWAKKQDLFNDKMPESRTLHRVFLGEFFRSPAYEYHCSSYYGYEGWTGGHDLPIPKEVLVTTEQYVWEYGNYDCSIDENIHIYLPAKWLTEFLSLRWNGFEGQFFDNENNLIAFDPSVRMVGPGALLLHRDALRVLNENGYDIIWVITGEKSIIGGRMTPDEWKGRLEISGVYRMRGNKIEGSTNGRFLSRVSEKKKNSDD